MSLSGGKALIEGLLRFSISRDEEGGVNMQVGFAGLLFMVFLVLKLTGVIAWSWLWITSPLWIGFILWLIIMALVLIVSAVT